MAVRRASTFAQRAMETPAVVRLYESRLWRRSPWTQAVLGLRFERERDLILAAADLPASGAVLDLACGSGLYARSFARALAAGSVVGLDLSRPMLHAAQRFAARERLDDLRLVRATALALPFPDARFDLVNCCGALHLFPDVARALAEVARVLRPGGRCTLAVARRQTGLRAPLTAVFARLGVTMFDRAALGELLGAAGLGDFRVHHDRALWMVASARRAHAV